MKYEVKVGQDFEPEQKFQVNVEVTITSEDKAKKSGLWTDWRIVAVLAVFVLVASFGAFAAYSGNTVLFDKALDTIVAVAEHLKGKSDGKESDKSHDSRPAGVGGAVVREAERAQG
jgi:hypothetical protein